ncbi:MAG: polysaccharide biosynthesis C-terminal domain-containing protein [Oscillospiraceae bacterium]|nr:polysaccharide biosynthesis C-terminal domain-containing protein [Oscillospiraceae bacterium]
MSKRLPIFYSALLLTGVNLLLRFVSTSFQVYISGKIGAAGVGLLQLVLSVGAMAMTLGVAGIRTTAMYLCAEEFGNNRLGSIGSVLSGCFFYSIICAGTIAIVLYGGAPYFATHWIGDERVIPSLRIYAAFLPVCCLCGVMTGFFTAANRIGTLVAVEVAEQLLSMAFTMVMLLGWAGHDPAKACISIVLGNGLSMCFTLVCLMILRSILWKVAETRIPVLRRLLSTAVPLALADDLKAGISTTENLMVPKRLGLYKGIDDPLAAFGVVCGMVFPVLMFPAAILYGLAELLIPELARCAATGSRQRIQYLARRSLRVSLIYGCCFGALEFLLAPELCQSLYRNSEAGQVLRLYAFLIPMLYCDAITDAMIKGLGQQTASVRYNILTSGLDVMLLFLLLPRYGMQGYFFSFLVTHLLNFILSIRRLIKIVGPMSDLSLPILSLGAAGISLWLCRFVAVPVLRGSAFLLIFFPMLFLLGVLQKEDVLWLKGLLHNKAQSGSG